MDPKLLEALENMKKQAQEPSPNETIDTSSMTEEERQAWLKQFLGSLSSPSKPPSAS